MKKYFACLFILSALLTLANGCINTTHEVKITELPPIKMTLDINVKIDNSLNDVYGDIDEEA